MKPFTVSVVQDYHLLWSTFPGRSSGSLLRSAFARRYLRSRCCFPFLQLLRCFSSLRSLYRPYTFRSESPYGGVAPFGDPRITAWLPAPLGLSQVPTSFIASQCQGIHHVPFQAWPCLPDPLWSAFTCVIVASRKRCMPRRVCMVPTIGQAPQCSHLPTAQRFSRFVFSVQLSHVVVSSIARIRPAPADTAVAERELALATIASLVKESLAGLSR